MFLGIGLSMSSGQGGAAMASPSLGLYGDGSDGAAVFDGVSIPNGTNLSGSVYTLNRDVYYTNVTLSNGVTVRAGFNPYAAGASGYRIFATGTITGTSGTINADGQSASGAGGAHGFGNANVGSVGFGRNGGTGTTAAGGAGLSNTSAFGGAGGAGGTSTGAAGAAGTVTLPGGMANVPRDAATAIIARVYDTNLTTPADIPWNGGAGGGGGGGDGTVAGGGGGGGGGVLIITAQQIGGAITYSAKGGNGFSPTSGNAAGGGGGGGGTVHLTCRVNTIISDGGTVSATHGLGAAGHGTGTAGSNGSDGQVVQIVN